MAGRAAPGGARRERPDLIRGDRLWRYAGEHFATTRFRTQYGLLSREHERTEPDSGVAVEPGYPPVADVAIALRVFGYAEVSIRALGVRSTLEPTDHL